MDDAVQAIDEPPAKVTVTVCGLVINEPLYPKCNVLWLSIKTGDVVPVSVTVKDWPAIVKVPDRVGPEFAATWYVTLPLPVPDDPLVMVRKLALLEAVHAQPLVATTFSV